MVALIVLWVINFLIGDHLSLTLKFFLWLIVGGGVYIFAFVKFRQMLS